MKICNFLLGRAQPESRSHVSWRLRTHWLTWVLCFRRLILETSQFSLVFHLLAQSTTWHGSHYSCHVPKFRIPDQPACNYCGRASFLPSVSRLMDLFRLHALRLSGNLGSLPRTQAGSTPTLCAQVTPTVQGCWAQTGFQTCLAPLERSLAVQSETKDTELGWPKTPGSSCIQSG